MKSSCLEQGCQRLKLRVQTCLQIHTDVTGRQIFPNVFNRNVSGIEFTWTEFNIIFAGMTT